MFIYFQGYELSLPIHYNIMKVLGSKLATFMLVDVSFKCWNIYAILTIGIHHIFSYFMATLILWRRKKGNEKM